MSRPHIFLLTLAWSLLVVIGLGRLWKYESTPGNAQAPLYRWPESSRLTRQPGRPTLLLLAHPRCPCTRASLSELAQIMARARHPLTAYVLFYRPKDAPTGWEKTDLYAQAEAIPGVFVRSDVSGDEARRFHATTSGQTLFYDPEGHLLFDGGITFARGHVGDNAGRQALLSLLSQGRGNRRQTPVFGCSLLGSVSK